MPAPDRADAAIKRVLVLDPANPQALRAVTDALAQAGNWAALVQTYQAALKARRDDDLGILMRSSQHRDHRNRRIVIAETAAS